MMRASVPAAATRSPPDLTRAVGGMSGKRPEADRECLMVSGLIIR